MSAVKIERESLSGDLALEILPLAQKCWDESSEKKGDSCAFSGKRDIKIEPDFALYQAIEKNGRLALFTVRDNGVLVGYAVALIYSSPHHCKMITANGDSFYLEPDYRIHAPVLVQKVINAVMEAGAVTINWGVTKDTPLFDLLSKLGFAADEVMMEKLLCALQ